MNNLLNDDDDDYGDGAFYIQANDDDDDDMRGSAFKDYKHCDYRLDKGLSIVIRDYLITCQSST